MIALGFEPASFSRTRPKASDSWFPAVSAAVLVACTFMGTKFPFRAPENRILLRCFLGGTPDDAVLLPSVLDELREMTGLTGEPLFSRIYRWPHSMAQYTVGHQRRIALIEARLKQNPGLHLAGNAYHGIGIPDCIRMGKQFAETALK